MTDSGNGMISQHSWCVKAAGLQKRSSDLILIFVIGGLFIILGCPWNDMSSPTYVSIFKYYQWRLGRCLRLLVVICHKQSVNHKQFIKSLLKLHCEYRSFLSVLSYAYSITSIMLEIKWNKSKHHRRSERFSRDTFRKRMIFINLTVELIIKHTFLFEFNSALYAFVLTL